MPASADVSAPPSYTLHGDELSWLDLILQGAVPPRYDAPADLDLPSPRQPSLEVPEPVATKSIAAGHLDLMDPEGVTRARLHVGGRVEDSMPWLVGEIAAIAGFEHHDHPTWRHAPQTIAASWPAGPVVALWQPAPVPFEVRDAARKLARQREGALLQIVGTPTGQETSHRSNLGARLVHYETTRDPIDRVVVLPEPALTNRPADVLLQAQVAARYGATAVALTPAQTGALGEHFSETVRAAATLGVELVTLDLDPAHGQLDPDHLDVLVTASQGLPEWFAEPAVAAEIARLHRPRTAAGLTVLLSGLSGSGKSTVARALAVRLMETEVRSVSLLDGDVVRHHLSKGLGFARADRDTNVRRIGFVASEITKAGGIAICCPIAPYDATRKDVRAMVEAEGGFVLVHVATPLEECERRDRKGLYAKARRGEIPEFTGISDPYEVPQDAEAVVDTTGRTIDSCVDDVMASLKELGYIE